MALDYSLFSLPTDESFDYMPLLFFSLLYRMREWSIQLEQQKNFSQFMSGPPGLRMDVTGEERARTTEQVTDNADNSVGCRLIRISGDNHSSSTSNHRPQTRLRELASVACVNHGNLYVSSSIGCRCRTFKSTVTRENFSGYYFRLSERYVTKLGTMNIQGSCS
jgi:hypothetical protein